MNMSIVKVEVVPVHAIKGMHGSSGIAPLTINLGNWRRRSRFRFPIVSLGFFIGVILPAALCNWGRLSL